MNFAVGLLWLYAVFLSPFILGFNEIFYWISLVAAILFTIPVGLMIFFGHKLRLHQIIEENSM